MTCLSYKNKTSKGFPQLKQDAQYQSYKPVSAAPNILKVDVVRTPHPHHCSRIINKHHVLKPLKSKCDACHNHTASSLGLTI